MRPQFGVERGGIRMPEPSRHAQAVERVGGQRVFLRIAQHLHAVFDATEETVGLGQPLRRGFRKMAGGGERRQRRQQATAAQRRFAAATDQLDGLHEELHLADAPGPRFRSSAMSLRATSASIIAFISRSESSAVKSR